MDLALRRERNSLRQKVSALRADNAALRQRVEQLTSLAIAVSDRRVAPASLRELAFYLRLNHQKLSRLLARADVDVATRGALEEWLVARGECAWCVSQLSPEAFAEQLRRHIQPIAAKGSRAPKEPQ